MCVRVLIADAPLLNRKALAALVASSPTCQVVGDVGTVGEAIAACRNTPHDVLLLDANAAGDGADPSASMAGILDASPDTRIIALVSDAGQRCVDVVRRSDGFPESARFPCCHRLDCAGVLLVAGASCVLTRDTQPAELCTSIRRVAAGRACLGAEVMRRMLDCVAHHRARPVRCLSARERQVAQLVAQGLCNKEIAAALEVGVPTVKKHMGHILTKLGLQDRLQLGLLVERNPDSVQAVVSGAPA